MTIRKMQCSHELEEVQQHSYCCSKHTAGTVHCNLHRAATGHITHKAVFLTKLQRACWICSTHSCWHSAQWPAQLLGTVRRRQQMKLPGLARQHQTVQRQCSEPGQLHWQYLLQGGNSSSIACMELGCMCGAGVRTMHAVMVYKSGFAVSTIAAVLRCLINLPKVSSWLGMTRYNSNVLPHLHLQLRHQPQLLPGCLLLAPAQASLQPRHGCLRRVQHIS